MANIIVIDDSPSIIGMLSKILEGASHQVVTCLDSREVEALIQSSPPDLILLDVVMPERNGYEVLRSLKRNPETATIPVILVSSKGEVTDIRWGKRQGAVDYIVKPFTADAVLEAVGAHLPA